MRNHRRAELTCLLLNRHKEQFQHLCIYIYISNVYNVLSVSSLSLDRATDEDGPPMAVLAAALLAASRSGGADRSQPDHRLLAYHLGRTSRQARLINFGSHYVRFEADPREAHPARQCLAGVAVQRHALRPAAHHQSAHRNDVQKRGGRFWAGEHVQRRSHHHIGLESVDDLSRELLPFAFIFVKWFVTSRHLFFPVLLFKETNCILISQWWIRITFSLFFFLSVVD